MTTEIKNILTGKKVPIEINQDILNRIFQNSIEEKELFMAPGLFDIQVNGYKNIDFNDNELSIPKIEKVVNELLKDGTTRFFPTLITNDPKIIERNLDLLNQAITKNPLISSCIPGIHIEGPFISDKDGFSGAHNKKWIRKPDPELFEKWQKISGNHIKLITLSPEHEGSMNFIKSCIKNNVKVSIGHSAATAEQIHEAASYGATLSTHLGNAISQNIHRHNNILFDQLAEDNLFASIITDGHHLPKSLIKIILRSKPDKTILISDSTKFTGMKPGIYDTVIGDKVVLNDNRRLSMYGNEEFFAGSASALYQCVNFLCREEILSLSDAWKAASVLPFKYLYNGNMDKDPADVVLFNYKDGKINILLSIKDNQYFSHYL